MSGMLLFLTALTLTPARFGPQVGATSQPLCLSRIQLPLSALPGAPGVDVTPRNGIPMPSVEGFNKTSGLTISLLTLPSR